MKLAKYLADYLVTGINKLHEAGMPMDYSEEGLEPIIQQGIEAFCSTEDSIVIVSKLNISTGHINEVERYDY